MSAQTEPVPNPGSVMALARGCVCPVGENNYGARPPYGDAWALTSDCPVHEPSLGGRLPEMGGER